MAKLTKSSFAAAKRRLGIKKVTKKNIGRIAKAARRGGKSRSRPTKRVKTRKTRRKSNPKRGGRNMSRKQSLWQVAKKLVPTGALVAPALAQAFRTDVNAQGKLEGIVEAYTGYNIRVKNFELGRMAEGWLPFIAATAAIQGITLGKKILRSIS